MKKTILLILAASIFGGLQAQTSVSVKPKTATASPLKLAQARLKAQQAAEKTSLARNAKGNHKIGNEPLLPPLGSSANVNGVRDAATTAVTANQACNLIVMTHREDYSKVGTCGTGAYEAAYSLNDGMAWDTSVTIFCNQPSRYPNGALFNPAGNTNPMNVTDAMAGPWTNSATTGDSWVESVYGSVTLGNSNPHENYLQNITPGVMTQNTGNLAYMSSSDDSTVHVIGEGFDVNTAGAYTRWQGAVLTTGKFNAVLDSFVWTQTRFYPHIVPSVKNWSSNVGLAYDSSAVPLGTPGTAWSKDGKIGYVVIFANLDSVGYNYASDQPIVYKTTDHGTTWNMMPPFNFSTIPSLTTYLYNASDSAVKVPLFYTFVVSLTGQSYAQGANSDFDLTVDAYGNLHIISAILSSAYSRPDSAYTLSWYLNQHGYIYDISTNGSGWNARFIDSMTTFATHVITASMSTDWDNTTASSVAFGNRLQASRSTDGKRIFATWLDDFTGIVTDSLVAPDVKGEGYNIATGLAGPVIQFTNTNNNYYLCASDIAMSSGGPDTTWTVPCTIVYPETTPCDGSTAVNYFYLGNVQYDNVLNAISAVPTISKQGFSISQNYPNPFSNVTNFNVSLTSESTVSVDVYSMVGQKVYSIAAQKMSSGNHIMTINANGWNAGVYFYKVTANNSSITQKMIVQ